MPIKQWSTTPASNNSTPPYGAPEGWAPSAVNDWARQTMADVRSWYDDAQWINRGDSISFAGSTSVKIVGSLQAAYAAGRRIKADVGAGTIYGTILSVTAAAGETTVVVTWDSGNLDASLSGVYVGIITPSNDALPAPWANRALTPVTIASGGTSASAALAAFDNIKQPASATYTGAAELATSGEVMAGSDSVRAATPDAIAGLWEMAATQSAVGTISIPASGGYIPVGGTTSLSGIAQAASGLELALVFSAAVPLVHDANHFILPTGAGFNTAAGDVAHFRCEGSSSGSAVWRCSGYLPATGQALAAGAGFNVQIFAASGTWTKPAGATFVRVRATAAGGGGGGVGTTTNSSSGGGGGGAGIEHIFEADSLSAAVAVTIGSGGTAGANTGGDGGTGGNTTFGGYLTAYGGGGGKGRDAASHGPGGGGGGAASAGAVGSTSGGGSGGAPAGGSASGGADVNAGALGGGAGGGVTSGGLNTSDGGDGGYGGGGGGCGSTSGTGTTGGDSYLGGGAGGGNGAAGGASVRGGAGGAGGTDAAGTAGTVPGGGGGGSKNTGATGRAGGIGADGRLEVYSW